MSFRAGRMAQQNVEALRSSLAFDLPHTNCRARQLLRASAGTNDPVEVAAPVFVVASQGEVCMSLIGARIAGSLVLWRLRSM
jgi:hypothetical protein